MLEFDKVYKQIKKTDINNLESLIGTKLPEDYVNHMLKYNGGYVPLIESDYLYIEKDKNRVLHFTSFKSIKHGYGDKNEEGTVDEFYKLYHPLWYPKLLVIGSMDCGVISMGIVEENYGQIFFNYSEEEPYKLCDNFTQLIESIVVVPWED